ncbi:polyprenol phosphomannose-dependent alpha 1,6 mannosyltransferase MptB [Actinoplanes sp. CA-015351]|uniref:polyprenol phosphomannose-dependent alpha 1,6 mannosyltransferase MptB n=1 Tax=Actinoplanes sp. CA-015351 TaxID=3239897 RepID=UPI003D98BE4A
MFSDHGARQLAFSRVAGAAGSFLIAGGGFAAGALPVGITFVTEVRHARLGLVCVYSGLALLLLAWWWYGRVTRSTPDESCRTHWQTLALWGAPFLIAPPLFSRDVYSYLAQGLMIDSGLDVYRYGPAVLGGAFAEQVPAIWQHTPSPYGPGFLIVAEAVAGLFSSHLVGGILAMRLVAVGGLILLAVALRTLAASAGVSPAAATWLAVLNPLVLIHFIGGAHNDALMAGLLAAGLAAAVRNRPVLGALLVAGAALIKAPAALGLVAVAVIWAGRLRGSWPQTRASVAVGFTAALATVLITAVAGTGYGWITALGTPITDGNWSLTGLLGRWSATMTQDASGAELAHSLWRGAGLLATLIVAVLVWIHRDRLGPVYGLGIVLVALVLFGPAIRPWYLVWGLVPIAAVAVGQGVRRTLAGFCGLLVLVVLPDGFAADGGRLMLALLGALLGVAVFMAARIAVVR